MYELDATDRMLLAAIGADGLPFRALRVLVADMTVLERLCDLLAMSGRATPTTVSSTCSATVDGRRWQTEAGQTTHDVEGVCEVSPGGRSGTRSRMESSEERKAVNEAIFRDANEKIEAARADLTAVDGRTPFLCECDDASCREIVRLDLAEYEQVRASPTTFLIAPGHPHGSDEIVAEHEDYLVVEKQGAAARVARETNPRVEHG
jgi:hypothetical protein